MKFKYGMSDKDRDNMVKRNILKNATALYNACNVARKENRCKGCPFALPHGCDLYGHPIEWEDKLCKAKLLREV